MGMVYYKALLDLDDGLVHALALCRGADWRGVGVSRHVESDAITMLE